MEKMASGSCIRPLGLGVVFCLTQNGLTCSILFHRQWQVMALRDTLARARLLDQPQ